MPKTLDERIKSKLEFYESIGRKPEPEKITFIADNHASLFAEWLDSLEEISLKTYNFKTLYCHYKGIIS